MLSSNGILHRGRHPIPSAPFAPRLRTSSGSLNGVPCCCVCAQDGEAYTQLLAQLAPGLCDLSPLEVEGTDRIERMLEQANKIGCRKFLQPKDVAEGNNNLNLAFIANLFNASRCVKAARPRPPPSLHDLCTIPIRSWLFDPTAQVPKCR